MPSTAAHVDHAQARRKLEQALELCKKNGIRSRYHTKIESVISGSHLTYRYILITNLLAMATNPQANGISLQSGAEIEGAFDARSLCHKVFVPFEREFLAGRLGRSNEPYLNKPARQKTLSLDNPVRAGSDREILATCVEILSGCTPQEAAQALADALYCTMRRPCLEDSAAARMDSGTHGSLHTILAQFTEALLSTASANGGESCALAAGLAFSLLASSFDNTLDVRVHPVNQSGASSNEVLDIDVYSRGKLRFTAEIKDKPYSREDVDHAANKVRRAGHGAMFFVEGPNAASSLTTSDIQSIGQQHGLHITVTSIRSLFDLALGFYPSQTGVDSGTVWAMMVTLCRNARFRQTTVDLVKRLAGEVGLTVQ